MKPIDLEFETMSLALAHAEMWTELGCEVTKPLKVAGMFCIRITRDE